MNRYGEFEDKCGSCGYFDLSNYRGYKYYCKKDYDFYEVTKPSCRHYISAEEMRDNRDYYDIKRANRSDCYLTTIICEILGMDDNCEILTIMRMFRNNVLQKNLNHVGLLVEYDMVGPLIADNLRKDENALWIAKELLEHYIKPIIIYINNDNYNAAIVLYQNMTNILKENYALVDCDEVVENYDQSMGGHGRVYRKVNC